VRDEDGEVLLIEVADHLPDWVTPHTSHNRVFIYQGRLHIIPLTKKNGPMFPPLSCPISEMIKVLISRPFQTQVSPIIQMTLEKRLSLYPQKALQQQHRTRVLLPKPLAMVLHQYPQLIAPAIECFITRDAIDMKVIHTNRFSREKYTILSSSFFFYSHVSKWSDFLLMMR
jgi:hypothetical protein